MTEREFGMIDMGLTRACNMRCKFCTAVGTHKNKKILSFEEFKCIFEKVEELGEFTQQVFFLWERGGTVA